MIALDFDPSTLTLTKPIVLIGMMGTGKTHIGRLLAKKLGISFVDSDDEIVASAGQSIVDIFERYGENAFRDLEKKVIRRLLETKACVISTGGGCITEPETLSVLTQNAHLVWLQSDLDILVERTSKRNDRPLLKDKDPKEVLSELLQARTPFYTQAHFHVNANHGGHDTVNQICQALEGLCN
jgi:shikimate kinase